MDVVEFTSCEMMHNKVSIEPTSSQLAATSLSRIMETTERRQASLWGVFRSSHDFRVKQRKLNLFGCFHGDGNEACSDR